MKRILVLLALSSGCLDSLVDNPCEDGYVLSADGSACVVIADDLQTATTPPSAERPPSPLAPSLPPPPPGTEPPVVPTKVDPTSTIETDGLVPCPTCK